jgi:hypothetical protein
MDMRGGYLFQSRPDIFPEGFLTETELLLWQVYYQDKLNRSGK